MSITDIYNLPRSEYYEFNYSRQVLYIIVNNLDKVYEVAISSNKENLTISSKESEVIRKIDGLYCRISDIKDIKVRHAIGDKGAEIVDIHKYPTDKSYYYIDIIANGFKIFIDIQSVPFMYEYKVVNDNLLYVIIGVNIEGCDMDFEEIYIRFLLNI